MRIVITGAAGRLGAALTIELRSAGHQVSPLGHTDLDITDRKQVDAVLKRLRPQVIINSSAYNAVDGAESDSSAAFALNAAGPANLAAAARQSDAVLMHYSTDFVFDGAASQPYPEEAATNPLSVYGASKLAGEKEVAKVRRHYVLRLESLFGGIGVKGHCATVDQIAETVLAGSTVRALQDRTVSPSHVADVSRASRALIEGACPFGLYHCVNSGFTTWYELALEVSRQLGITAHVVPIVTSNLVTPAPRPRFCALSNHKLTALGIEMPSWNRALECHLKARYGETAAAALRSHIA